MKAVATRIAVRENRERDWQDAALLLTLVSDPIATAAECGKSDRRKLRLLEPLADRGHPAWSALGDEGWRTGTAFRSSLDEGAAYLTGQRAGR